MYCTKCGKPLPQGSNVCSYCGAVQKGAGNGMQYQSRGAVDNIFSALAYGKTPGVIMEFVLWCIVCADVLLSLIASILANGNITWILLMVFSIGLAVILAFRLKPIAMLYGAGTFFLICNIVHFVSFYNKSMDCLYEDYDYMYSYFAFTIVLFVLEMLVVIGVITCAFIQFFSKIRLGNALTILVAVNLGLAVFRQIMMYAVPFSGTSSGLNLNAVVRTRLNTDSYWFGTICLWIILIVMTLLYIFFFWGAIDSRNEKILKSMNVAASAGGNRQGNIGLRGIRGIYAGQTILLGAKPITIGSGRQMMLVIASPYVSEQHCAIRFNSQNGCYEIYDNSKNGVRLKSGRGLQKGVYNLVRRGEVISIGSDEQQFILL